MKKFVVAALAAGTLLAAGAPPAQADHDRVCTSHVPDYAWICVYGHEHLAPSGTEDEIASAKAAAIGAIDASRTVAMAALEEGSTAAENVPNLVCAPPHWQYPVCVSGLQSATKWYFDTAGPTALDQVFCRLYGAFGDFRCLDEAPRRLVGLIPRW